MRNVLRVIGHLGKDAETKTLTSGGTVLNFNVASTESWKDKNGEKKQQTTWVSCSKFFGEKESQGVVPFLKKGTHVIVEGKASARAYLNARGEAEAVLELRVTDILLLDSKREEGTTTTAPTSQAQQSQQPPVLNPPQINEPMQAMAEAGDDLLF